MTTIYGTMGDDTLYPINNFDYLTAGAGNDQIYLSYGDIAKGGKGDDTFFGGANDTLYGGNGNDHFTNPDDGRDMMPSQYGHLYGGNGDDSFLVDAGNTVHGDAGNDWILDASSDGGNVLCGDGGRDTIYGAHDILRGGSGDDELSGGSDATLSGGRGHDTFVLPADGTTDLTRDSAGHYHHGAATLMDYNPAEDTLIWQ